MKLTKKQAKELSIKKWEYIVGNKGKSNGLNEVHPELLKLYCNCGYCENYFNNICKNCPLLIKVNNQWLNCGIGSHPWNIWFNKQTKINAQKVLDLIRES